MDNIMKGKCPGCGEYTELERCDYCGDCFCQDCIDEHKEDCPERPEGEE